MKEKDIHDLIEQQNQEVKQRIWQKILSRLPDISPQPSTAEKPDLDKACKTNRDKQDTSD